MGSTKVGDFDIEETTALPLLALPNAFGKPNSDVLRPFRNGSDIVRADSKRWVIDYGVATRLKLPPVTRDRFKHLEKFVRPFREKNNRAHYREKWWIHAEARPGFRAATAPIPRYLGTARVAKHRLFVWLDSVVLPDSKVIALAFADDCRFGILHSRLHELWTLATCGWHGKGNDATYNPTECFETFPFPRPTPAQEAAIAAAAKELNECANAGSIRPNGRARNFWSSPPAWTAVALYVDCGGKRSATPLSPAPGAQSAVAADALPAHSKIGLARYPRLVPRDADCAAKLKKRTLTNLYNERPAWLDLAHKKLDAAVAAAYGWPADLSDEQILEKLLA